MSRGSASPGGVAFPPRRVLLLVIPGFLTVQAAAVYAAVLVAATGPRVPAVVAGIVAACIVAAAMVPEWMAIRSAVVGMRIDDEVLVLPGLVRGHRRVPLADIAGLGMQYSASGRSSGWRPFVWLVDGHCLRLNLAAPTHSAPQNQRGRLRPRPGDAPSLDWDYVASSPAGRAAQQIAARVLAVQGPSGPWGTLQREATASRPDTLRTAFWSPSGAMGVLGSTRSAA